MGTNIVAAYVAGGRAHEVPAVMDALALKASDGFEIAFNQACADVAVRKLDAAEQQLLLAQRLGKMCNPLNFYSHAANWVDACSYLVLVSQMHLHSNELCIIIFSSYYIIILYHHILCITWQLC